QSVRSVDQNLYWIWTNYLSFNYNFNDFLNLQVMLGQEAQESKWEGMSGSRKVFISNDIQELNAGDSETAGNGGYKGSSAIESYFGRAVFNFLDRYMLTSTFRYDGSSKFADGNKWGFFPSFAVAWKINKENFMSNVDFISNLKLRAGYGAVGNQGVSNYLYGVSLTNYPTKFGTGLLPSNYSNEELQWETSNTYNLGLDLAILNNRIEIVAEVYRKYVDNLLMRLPLPLMMGSSGTGSIAAPWVNIGKMENEGFELTLNTVNTTGQVKWNTGITFTMNRNKVTNVADNVIDGYVQWFDHVTRTDVGKPVGQFYGYVVEGVFANAEDIQNHASQSASIDKYAGTWVGDLKFSDLNGDGIINEEDRTVIGDPNPDFSFGINNTVSYKGFDLSLLLTGMYGNDVFNYMRRKTESLDGRTNQMATITDRAQLAVIDEGVSDEIVNNVYLVNVGTDLPRISTSDPNNNRRISSRYIEDGSFLRIKNLSVGYTLPQNLVSKAGISNCRVYLNFQNIYTFSKYKGYDPEVGNYNQSPVLLGIDNGYYPSPTIYTIGANINF
ncbi:MAG: SusC/RagA family TonB-linked outer membrane protein, partial [Bacteroidales bacterium]|nr:SusC/RagA family TonB-linked outer membrane protein [Bacteroidales bacterium]